MWDLMKDHAARNNFPKSANPEVQHIYNRPVTLRDIDYHLNTVRFVIVYLFSVLFVLRETDIDGSFLS